MMVGVLDQFGKPHGEFDPLTQLLGAGAAAGGCRSTQPFHLRQQGLEVLLQEPLTKCRVGARTGKVGIRDRREGAHNEALALKLEGNMEN